MLIHPTIANLRDLKLFGMVQALEAQLQVPEAIDLVFEDRLGLLADAELTARNNKRLQTTSNKTQRRKAASIRLCRRC
jgi:hypothetical protein